MSLLDALRARLHDSGLNLLGVADLAGYDARVGAARQSQALMPGARSIVVVGNGGAALWRAFLADLERDTRRLTHEPHPLEAFVHREVQRADAVLGDLARRWYFAASDAPFQVDFRLLGYLAGLGTDSRLRLLMHPEHGPWVGLRAACFVDAVLPASTPGGPDLCSGCPAPCVSACPGGAFPGGTWDVDRCSTFHAESVQCANTCHARWACPQGAASRYPVEALAYHANTFLGRRGLREHLGVPESEDRYPGTPPLWGSWRSRIDVKG
ncbi:hypothetical protein [Pyxidicoccus caerfyrddinensis]|uniref:hypothetical protein n=1 Tax=Pyxidicoccus caerfyrddinensis TaxID=2709663 RepID=UPI0013DB2DBB|nr:hypothetical protein [Pyxidicoccus caerfyrddinensis]